MPKLQVCYVKSYHNSPISEKKKNTGRYVLDIYKVCI